MALALKAMSEMWLSDNVSGAVRVLKRVAKLTPNVARVQQSLGTALSSSGDMAGAEKCFKRALELEPLNSANMLHLALVKKHDQLEPFAVRMLELVEDGRIDDGQLSQMHFALAKIFADMRDHSQAFEHISKANALTPGHYNPATTEQHLKSVQQVRDSGEFAELPPSGIGSAKPLFIVGMARSGTTLVETILSQHSQVRPCGEMPDILDIERDLTGEASARAGKSLSHLQALLATSAEDLRRKGDDLLAKVHKNGQGQYRVFTDKMPANGPRLGLISRLFPNAKIIYLQRDPRDCAISSLFARLHVNYGYTRRLDWFGHYARYYAGVVSTWRQMIQPDVFDLNYEELVHDPEPHIRAMLEFAGLKFEPGCLHPERSRASIKTASAWQARQGINANSVGRWQDYSQWLEPLHEALETHRHLNED